MERVLGPKQGQETELGVLTDQIACQNPQTYPGRICDMQLLSSEALARPTLADQARKILETQQRQTLVTMKQIAAELRPRLRNWSATLQTCPPRPDDLEASGGRI